MNITILGHVCIDNNTSENATHMSAGGPAMFMDKIFKKLPDVTVTIIASYGKDFLEYKKQAGFYPPDPKSLKSLTYENVSKGGKRSQKAYNREAAVPIFTDENVQSVLAKTDICFIAPLLPNYSAEHVKSTISNLPSNSLKVLLPQGYYRNFDEENNVIIRQFSEANEIIPLVDIVIVSEHDGVNVENTVKKWAQKYDAIVVVTKGEKGAVAIVKNQTLSLPVEPVEEKDIVDSVGSGDVFSAGFAYRYYKTHDIVEAGRFANELARQCLFAGPDNIEINLTALLSE